jgi:hypothetical protein
VDKIVIDQVSLGRFINNLHPGAYVSVVEVNFKALDAVGVRPLGVYGSQSQIVEFLLGIKAIDGETYVMIASMIVLYSPLSKSAAALRASEDNPADPSAPHLRSGLYILRHVGNGFDQDLIYIIFWPQTSTWDDNAESAVRRNRVTFMRYVSLTLVNVTVLIGRKISDQDMSPDHGVSSS